MPYRLRGNRVEKQEGGKWVLVKEHPNRNAAHKHYVALLINVSAKEKK